MRILMQSGMIPRCILTVPFVPTFNIVYNGPSLGADNFRRRPDFFVIRYDNQHYVYV
jgi:hypothetical protein